MLCCLAPCAAAQTYDFTPAPQTDLNRVYRVNRFTGEVTACQYGLKEGTAGVTLCYPAGEGAAAGPQSDYALVASRHEREGGVFRVDRRSGAISVCYVFAEEVVCTPPGQAEPKPLAAASPAAPAPPQAPGSGKPPAPAAAGKPPADPVVTGSVPARN
jgi:hypothetical protein